MNLIHISRASSALPRLFCVLAALFVVFSVSHASATVLPVGDEKDYWSDMAFPTAVTGGYNAGTIAFTIGASPSNDFEIGPEFGPSNLGRHYGTSGALGGPYST